MRLPPAYEAIQALRDRAYLRNAERRGSYAQHGEDVSLMRMLVEAGAHGSYVDVGSNHPFKPSNTFLLYRSGWRGLCIDPLPRFAPLYRRWRPEDRFESAAIGQAAGELPLYEFESDVLSTLDGGLATQYLAQGERLRQISRVAISRLDTVLEANALQAPISLLSIDIEGHELPALRSIDLNRWRPQFVCIEALTAGGRRNDEAIEFLFARGYRLASDQGLNIILRRSPEAPTL